MCMFVCVCDMLLCVHVYGRQRTTCCVISQKLFTLLLESASLVGLALLVWLGCLASEAQRVSWLQFLSTKLQVCTIVPAFSNIY